MGNLFATASVEEDSSSYEDDSSQGSDNNDMERCEDMTLDASETSNFYTCQRSPRLNNVTLEKIQEIEGDLDTYERVSLIYLLYDVPLMALQYIKTLLENERQNSSHSILTEWAKSDSNSNLWKNKLIEALCIIQNYQMLRKLGFDKNEIATHFVPLRGKALFINTVRKHLYRFCENIDEDQKKKFLQYLRNDLTEKHIEYDFDNLDNNYLEMFLLELEIVKYITTKQLQNIAKICKYMDFDDFHDTFTKLSVRNDSVDVYRDFSSNSKLYVDDIHIDNKPHGVIRQLVNKPEKVIISKKIEPDTSLNVNYDIDQKNPGIVLIINNEDFHTEFRKEYVDQLPKTDFQLETRHGSEVDQNRLKETFEEFGFEVRILKNLTHEKLLRNIEDVTKEIVHQSSIFVVVLSHGIEGAVFGVNSIPISVTDIKHIMCNSNKNLIGKPKVLILQSCQGQKCQELYDNNYEYDGPRNVPAIPKTADMLVFWATVPGFGAIRHRKEGTWFIQALCKTMIDNETEHFQDICVHVQSVVTSKTWGYKVMVPLVETTFSKFLYLPKLRQ